MINNPKKPDSKEQNNSISIKQSIALVLEFGFVIVLPLVFFGGIGKYLDSRYATGKMYTLIGLLVALISTVIWLFRKIKDIEKNYFNRK